MTAPLSSFSGLVSGFDYQKLVDEIIRLDARPADQARAKADEARSRIAALATFRSKLDALRTAAITLRDGSAFDATSATVAPLTGTRALVAVSTTAGVTPASFDIEVSQLAKAQKLGSAGQPSATTALGLSGTFTINGKSVTVAAGDSLSAIRDAINAVDTGASPSGVSASILAVSPTEQRLVLTSRAAGAAGIALADTTGTALQSLGFLDGAGDLAAGAELVAGSDAAFRIDGVDFTRTTNVVTDAIAGVSLTLTAADVGAVTHVTVDRSLDGARAAAQKFVDAYNTVMDFVRQQSTSGDKLPALYGEGALRTLRSNLPHQLLTVVSGAGAGLETMARAGFTLGRDGKLSLDATRFDAAFRDRHADLRTLVTERLSATDASVTTLAAGTAADGAYAVQITAAAARGTTITSGFAGVYDAGATPDTITVSDALSGQSVTVQLTTGMTTGAIVTALTDALTTAKINVGVTQVGNEIQLTHGAYGSAARFTVHNTNGSGDGASELWTSPVTTAGTDIAGTIGGHAAAGSGQVLVGASGTPVAGLSIRYSGAIAGAFGNATIQLGAGALVENALDTLLAANTGTLASREASLSGRIDALERHATTLEQRLEIKRANLLKQFIAMEASVSRLRQQSTSIVALSQRAQG